MEYFAGEYDVIVVGAGHAGCEAALACARLGLKTVIFTMNLDSIANLPCNPSIGGTGKGHLVREIDALGGEMGKVADKALIQSKTLNRAKGPAVYSLRSQIDRRKYQSLMKNVLESQENLDLKQGEVYEFRVKTREGKRYVSSIVTQTGAIYDSKALIISTGTYLKADIIIGDVVINSGPDGLFPANKLSESLEKNDIELLRFKTGTPARVNQLSIDFKKMHIQPGDEPIRPFSYETESIDIEQVPCWLTYTTGETKKIVEENLHLSPLYSGKITGTGTRYCPSFEDKIVRFAEKDRHQVFIEPMGPDTQEMYVQGMSSSLPEDVQEKMIKTVPGLENVSIMRTGYAIEYDLINPDQLDLTLEFKDIGGLYFAGQVNGSSGYEEAAAQGLIAGINAAAKIYKREPFVLDRSEAYIGVLIDDLITKSTMEPYRIMTSRAEYRLLLRQDNADMRLTEYGYKIGLISEGRYESFINKKKFIEDEIERLDKTIIPPGDEINGFLTQRGSTKIVTGVKLKDLLKRPEIDYDGLGVVDKKRPELSFDVKEQVSIQIKYEGYINRQLKQVKQFKKLEERKIPEDIDYEGIKNLRIEARQKLSKIKPVSLGQASRISGVSPADISALIIYLDVVRRGK